MTDPTIHEPDGEPQLDSTVLTTGRVSIHKTDNADYLAIAAARKGEFPRTFKISIGSAEVLLAELAALIPTPEPAGEPKKSTLMPALQAEYALQKELGNTHFHVHLISEAIVEIRSLCAEINTLRQLLDKAGPTPEPQGEKCQSLAEYLCPALRQYRHNSGGDDLFCGYDCEEIHKLVAPLFNACHGTGTEPRRGWWELTEDGVRTLEFIQARRK